ncbi:MAG: DUF1311 domain-containing protein [Acidisphaera sp.]|nr:DUF1311 domain-containing protein [Acidisphaera sp.]
MLAICVLVMVGSVAARADTACDKPRNDFDSLYCLSKIYQQADQDLNASYARLQGRLNDPERDALRTGQLAWLRSRDEQCSRREPEGFYVNMACATRTTISRNRFLEDRYRECISSGCLNSRLSEPQ